MPNRRSSSVRALTASAVFFWESFISELAQRANVDQYAYRRNLLADDPLALRVLDAAAQASGWTAPAPQNTFRGIAYNCYIGRGGRFKTYVAEVAELARVGGRLAIKRVFCAVDPGLVVNPNTLHALIEGGIGFALTNTVKSRITFSNGQFLSWNINHLGNFIPAESGSTEGERQLPA